MLFFFKPKSQQNMFSKFYQIFFARPLKSLKINLSISRFVMEEVATPNLFKRKSEQTNFVANWQQFVFL